MANTAAYSVARGVRMARLFREQRGLKDVRACDVEALAAADGIRIDEYPRPTNDFVAALVRHDSVAGILLAPNQNVGRRRFSIAHELAHYHIPTHRTPGPYRFCSAKELKAVGRSADDTEQEANDFATELLMPSRLFSSDSKSMSPSIASAITLAEAAMYNVSVSAAAFRIAETTREPVMLVATRHGTIEWCFASRNWVFGLAKKGDAIPSDSLARTAHERKQSFVSPLDVAPHAWIGINPSRCGELLESCHWIGVVETALSLLWAPPENVRDED